ncbi:MAG: condensation domain-containing protein, partial [Gammaproteobacteria bacterium]
MKDLDTFLAEVRGIGVKLWVEGGRLKLRAPEGVLTPELTDALRERKAEILALLRPQPAYAIPPVPAAESYELSAAQRRLWVLAQFPEASAAYNIPLHQFLEGSLDVVALEEALNRLVRRHESLRTTFIAVDGEPRQVVHAELRTPLEFRDLEDLEHPEEAARQLGRQAAVEPFDLENGPLLKAGLLRLGPERHILLFTLHHIVSDGVSIGVLTRDLSELYEAARTGRPARLPPLSIGYTAYTVWQNQRLADEFMAVHRRYWLVKLSGELPVLDLPADYPRPPVQTFRGRELSFTLPAGRLEALRAYCRERSASLFMALHAVLKVLLFAYTGKPDLIIGSPVAGRDHPDLNDQIGLYLNTLALRDPIRADQTFEQFFAQVRQTTTEAFDHGIYPFDRLVNELHLKRDLSRFPLFDVVLILQNQDEPGLTLGEISARPVFEHPGTSKFDLTFCFKESPAGLILGLEFNTDLFREDRIRCMGNHVLTLIGSILGNPDQAVGRLNLLTDAERRQLLDEFNRTAAPYPRDRTLVDL